MARKKLRRGAEEKSTELTGDLITEIISRLPVKDLLRFSCVSKSWSSLIYTDHRLSRLQFDRTASNDRPCFVIKKLYDTCCYWFDLDSIDDESAKLELIHNPWINEDDENAKEDDLDKDDDQIEDDDDSHRPQNAKEDDLDDDDDQIEDDDDDQIEDDDDSHRPRVIVIGSCHGLLVLQQLPSRKILVLNPTTKKHHLVPPNPAGDDNVVVSGFGYDQVHACYKLVTRVIPPSRDDHAAEVMIYNVNNGTWRKSKFDGEDYSSFPPYDFGGEYLDGALYWCIGPRNKELMKIIRFVLAEEEFEEVEPPNFYMIIKDNPNVTVFDGRLCLACEDRSKPNCYNYSMEFWVMEERQLGSSYSRRWTNILSILDPDYLLSRAFSDPSLIPICFSACGNKILFRVDGMQLFWYDIGNNKFIKLKNPTNKHPDYGRVGVTCCVRSLIGSGLF